MDANLKNITSRSNCINYQKAPRFCNNQWEFGEFTVSPCHCFQVFSVIFMGPCPLKLDFIKNYLLRDFFHHQQYHLLALSKRIGTPTRKTERWNLQQHRSCFLAKKLSVVCEFLAKPWDEGLANKRNVWNKLHPWSFRVRQLEDEVSF